MLFQLTSTLISKFQTLFYEYWITQDLVVHLNLLRAIFLEYFDFMGYFTSSILCIRKFWKITLVSRSTLHRFFFLISVTIFRERSMLRYTFRYDQRYFSQFSISSIVSSWFQLGLMSHQMSLIMRGQQDK